MEEDVARAIREHRQSREEEERKLQERVRRGNDQCGFISFGSATSGRYGGYMACLLSGTFADLKDDQNPLTMAHPFPSRLKT